MNDAAIAWDADAKSLAADPVATIALDRQAWESLGAVFKDFDDRQGEKPGLATATVQTADGPAIIGVVDYGESATYLLVPGDEQERLTTTVAVLETLQAGGAIQLEDDLLDLVGSALAAALEALLREAPTDAVRDEAEDDSGLAAPHSSPTDRGVGAHESGPELRHPAAHSLTDRELRVLALIAEGHPTREVAEQLQYSERTVKHVLHDVVTKLNARSRSQAVAHAVRAGLI